MPLWSHRQRAGSLGNMPRSKERLETYSASIHRVKGKPEKVPTASVHLWNLNSETEKENEKTKTMKYNLQFRLHQQLIQICEFVSVDIQTNETDSTCEITGCKNSACQNIFSPLHLLLLPPPRISLNEMQRAITHYPINWGRHLTSYTALDSANYMSGLSVSSQ